jgi:co-chaperonin GroES (HSP10)
MIINPQPRTVQLKIEEAKAGDLVTTSRETAIEVAEVLAIGDWVSDIAVGDKIFVKAWAIDIITYNDVRYYFCNINTGGILATIKE